MPEFETLNDALVECVKAAGGSKTVGHKMWPEKTVDAAQRHLLNCLAEGRAERLTPDQALFVARLAREAGCHAYMQYVAASLLYQTPVPREPAQELAELQRQFATSVAQQQLVLARITELMGALPPGMVGGLKAVA